MEYLLGPLLIGTASMAAFLSFRSTSLSTQVRAACDKVYEADLKLTRSDNLSD